MYTSTHFFSKQANTIELHIDASNGAEIRTFGLRSNYS